jgi:hypothetical protein
MPQAELSQAFGLPPAVVHLKPLPAILWAIASATAQARFIGTKAGETRNCLFPSSLQPQASSLACKRHAKPAKIRRRCDTYRNRSITYEHNRGRCAHIRGQSGSFRVISSQKRAKNGAILASFALPNRPKRPWRSPNRPRPPKKHPVFGSTPQKNFWNFSRPSRPGREKHCPRAGRLVE